MRGKSLSLRYHLTTKSDPQNQGSTIPFSPHRVKHIVRHLYHPTMQKLFKFEA